MGDVVDYIVGACGNPFVVDEDDEFRPWSLVPLAGRRRVLDVAADCPWASDVCSLERLERLEQMANSSFQLVLGRSDQAPALVGTVHGTAFDCPEFQLTRVDRSPPDALAPMSRDVKPAAPAEEAGKRLIVGQGISLSGEITACDRLIVEGKVQVTLNETKAIEISETGEFTSGKAEVIRMTYCQIVHHRAQLGVFLRLLDVKIPGSYGPSADEMPLK